MVSDVSNIKVSNNNNGNNGNKGKEEETLVRPVTILTWHEQRLNKMDETIKNLTDYVPRELVEGLVDTISQLNAKIEVLTNAYNNLIE